jgi:hypothetical protein
MGTFLTIPLASSSCMAKESDLLVFDIYWTKIFIVGRSVYQREMKVCVSSQFHRAILPEVNYIIVRQNEVINNFKSGVQK